MFAQRLHPTLLLTLLVSFALSAPLFAQAQILVLPVRPSQSSVRYERFDWHVQDLQVDVHDPAKAQNPPLSGHFKFYFYESERNVAGIAAHGIIDDYRRLAREFDFIPPKAFPYFLYNR